MPPKRVEVGIQPKRKTGARVKFLNHPTPSTAQIKYTGSGGEMASHQIAEEVRGWPPTGVVAGVSATVSLLPLQ
jgi:negative regulator of sigma E activity